MFIYFLIFITIKWNTFANTFRKHVPAITLHHYELFLCQSVCVCVCAPAFRRTSNSTDIYFLSINHSCSIAFICMCISWFSATIGHELVHGIQKGDSRNKEFNFFILIFRYRFQSNGLYFHILCERLKYNFKTKL